MSITSALESIGLARNEVKVYMSLLELGSSTSGAIIKKTGIHTSKVYDALQRLADKGLVTHIIKANTKHFRAVDPSRIIDFLKDKKKTIEEQESQVNDLLPQLKQMVGRDVDQTKAEIFSGWKGLDTVYSMLRRSMKKGEMNYVFGASRGEDFERTHAFFSKHVREIARKGIKQKVIYNADAWEMIEEQSRYKGLFQIRYITNTTPAEINIWHDKTMIVILRKSPTLILIEDQKVADSFRRYFDVMWLMAKK